MNSALNSGASPFPYGLAASGVPGCAQVSAAHCLHYFPCRVCGRLTRPGRNNEGRTEIMREGLTNAGKKEQRQINQIIDKQAKEGRQGAKETSAHTVPKQHRMKGAKTK